MKKNKLIEELETMSAIELGRRLINPKLTNIQRQEILKLWYVLSRKNSRKMTKIDPPKK